MKGTSGFILMVVACCFIAGNSYAQAARPADTTRKVMQQPMRLKPKGPKPIKHEISGGLRLNSNGYSIYTDYGTVRSRNVKTADMFYNLRVLQLEFTEKKSPKEEKTVVDGSAGTGSGKYIYSKINNFYALKLGYGFSKMLAGKPDPGSVSVHWVNIFGVSLGMLKPYYLNVFSDPNAIKYSEDNKTNFFNQYLIIGNAGFSKGIGEMKFIPGGHFKSALHFDFAATRKNVLGAELGVNVEYYSADVPIMFNEKATPYFVDLFLAVQFGKRW